MKKRLVSAAVTVALFIGLIAGVTFKASDKKEINLNYSRNNSISS